MIAIRRSTVLVDIMLAEIFVLRLEAIARAAQSAVFANNDRFVKPDPAPSDVSASQPTRWLSKKS